VVELQGNASIHAPGGSVNAYATANPALLHPNGGAQPAADDGSFYMDSGSSIDVSGLQAVSVPVTQNLVQVTLETNDLQNDPLLRDGFLHGTTVTVDINKPPSLFDVTPYAQNIGSNIEQMMSAAGAINLNSTGTLITRAGSTLNVSGGSIAYQGGYGPSTTNLLAANGQVFNISAAPGTMEYVAIANGYSYTDPTWGITNKGNGQSYYAGYTQGANAGSIDVQGPQVYLRGSMQATTVDGLHQRTLSSLAKGGTFVLGCATCSNLSGGPDFGLDGGVTFADGLTDNLVGNVILDGNVISSVNMPSITSLSPAQLTQGGFSTISVSSNGGVTIPAGITLAISANGSFTARSTQGIGIDGDMRIPGGSVSLQTISSSTADPISHDIDIGPGAVIDVSGGWTNDSPTVTRQPGTAPVVLNGGTVSVSADGSVFLGAGSLVNVSGGGWINQSNVLSDGIAGEISLAASFSVSPGTPATTPFTGLVDFGQGATLLGASLKSGGGGTLALQSGSLTVAPATAGTPGELLLAPDFFTQGGFARYNLTGQNDVIIGNLKDTGDIAPLTIAPLEQNLVFTSNAFLQPTGSSIGAFTHLVALPVSLRAPASVSFTATASDGSHSEIGDVSLAGDAAIVTDPGADVVLAANGFNGNVRVFGSITAPGGDITLQLENPLIPLQGSGDPGYLANQDIELGPNALLAAPGYAQIDTLDPHGYREGAILAGGTVSLIANKGFVKTDPGSVINVSGASGILDLVGVNGVTSTRANSNAGTVNIGAREGIVLQGELLAQPASLNGSPLAGAAGGTLNLALGPAYSDAGPTGTGAVDALGGANYPTAQRTLTLAGLNAAGSPAIPPSNQLLSGTAVIDVSTIQDAGFANVAISSADEIAFTGAVTLGAAARLTLDAPLFIGNQSALVNLSAPYIAVGNYLNNSEYFDSALPSPNAAAVLNPTAGMAALNLNAQLIDVRGISGWSGFSQENLTSSGDIRFVAGANSIGTPPAVNAPGNPGFEGALNTSANLTLQAAQIYPTTATGFAINDLPSAATGPSPAVPTLITIDPVLSPGTIPATPLSAGGSLSINATDIVQNGVVRAPMGEIALNGVPILDAQGAVVTPGNVTLTSGSLTSVSADGLLIPFGSTANGIQWTYSPAAGSTNILAQPPDKQISLNGSSVSVNGGAKLDLSGGGDLYAYEFIAGQGGSVDVLDPASLPAANHPAGTTVYTYAILPSLGSPFAPVDAQYGQGSALAGQTITVSGVPGLPPGTYALLPAPYALLPGAFAVHVVQQNSGIAPGSSVEEANGAYQVAARFGVAGTSIQSSLTSTVLVASDASVRSESQYTDSLANSFFNSAAQSSGSAAPRLPADAGQLLLSAANSLSLNGSISFGKGSFISGTTSSGAPIMTQGQGGDVAITAENILVVDATAQTPSVPGTLQLNVQQLDNLNAQTLILGATSSATPAGELLTVGTTQTVELKNTVALAAPEIILAARDSVTVDPNAQIGASGTGGSSQAPGALILAGGGALLRVSNGAAATLNVDPASLPPNPTGIVSIGAAANVSAAGSLLLYGTNNTILAPGAQISAPAVGLYSSAVSMGDVPAGTPGLALSSQLLGSLRGLTDLTIGSSSTINFYGAVQLGTPGSATSGLNSISLDAAGLGGYGAGDKVLQAGGITLMNSSGSAANFAAAPNGSGVLQLIAGAGGSPASGQITLGTGSKTISGFTGLDLLAAGNIVGQGTGTLNVASQSLVPVNMSASALTGSAGSNQTVTTTGAITLNSAAANTQLTAAAASLGAALTLQGSSIAQNGTINLPAGAISLIASNGDVALGASSTTSAAGAVRSYTVTSAAAAGGNIDLLSQTGNVVIAAGATVDVSGASMGAGSNSVKGDAGSLSVAAPQGTFTYAGGNLKGAAAAGQSQGNFSLDVASGLAGDGFDALDAMLAAGGFGGALNVRTRGDAAVTIGTTVQAGSFQLAVDQGTIDVAGSAVINTSGSMGFNTDGGSIALWAANGLILEAGAQLLANAGANGPVGANGANLAARGGDITLGTASGNIAIAGGTPQRPTTISMHGGGGADSDGTLTLRAPRTADEANVQIQISDPTSLDVVSGKPVIVEGFKTYSASDLGNSDAGCGSGGTCNINNLSGMLFTDAAAFAGNSTAIAVGLGLAGVAVRPGIEIDGSGDLIVNDSSKVWDLASWNAAIGVPVNLTLRAAGNLIFESSLSDGFTSGVGKAVNAWVFGEPGAAKDSASYALTAGADLAAANPLAVVPQAATASSLGAPPNTGNVILTAGTLIRTGTGNISIAAGGDLLLGYNVGDAHGNLYDNGALLTAESDPLSAVIYTAGMPSILTPAQSTEFSPTSLPLKLTRLGVAVSYPTDGGDINITAADDVRSAASAQLVSDWLWRRGRADGLDPTSGTSWWIAFSQFEQGIGVLGGGNLSLAAGRDIVNTDAVIPTTGRLLVAGATPVAADLVLTGGGNLGVHAGGNIVSGVFEADWGNASIAAGGALTSSSDSTFGQQTTGINTSSAGFPLPAAETEIYPVLVVGNGVFDVSARTGIALDGVANSTTLPLIAANASLVSATGQGAAFYPYAPTSNPGTLNLVSSAGDVVLNNDPVSNVPIAALSTANLVYDPSGNPKNYLAVYPSTLNVASLSGDIDLGAAPLSQAPSSGAVQITLFPGAAGNLDLLASGSIHNNGTGYQITLSEADPALVPNVLAPVATLIFNGLDGAALPQTPLHQNDPQPISLVANAGDIQSGQLTFPKAANVIAGGDITDLNFIGKNLNPSDVTLITAGGSISYSTPTMPVTNALLENTNGISVAGPGFLEVLAGNSINLGDSNGIVTTGSLSDLRLPTSGATMILGAGLGNNGDGSLRQPAYQAFAEAYLAPNAATGAPGSYAQTLVGYMEQIEPGAPGLGYSAAVTAFEALTPAQQLPLLAQVLSDELSATGLAHTLQGTNYDRGYTAIDTLFPAKAANGNALSYAGNLDLFFSQVKTEQGGDINLLVPGGSVVVGLANPPASLSTVKQVTTATGLVIPADVNLGVLVLGQGAIQGFADQDFLVNQSRMLTLEGGNIILWASNGNIDAGKGAKSASGAPPPVIQTDANGNLFVDPSNAVSGSGIGQLLTTPGLTAGLVNLIAPKGAVDSGDAGIRVAGNLNIAAVQVIGAGNITVVGTSTGVPVSEAGALAGALSGANSLGDASKNAVDQLSQDLVGSTNYQNLTNSLLPTFISVKMFCLGVECETN
jgi:filamentous hemagglutinin